MKHFKSQLFYPILALACLGLNSCLTSQANESEPQGSSIELTSSTEVISSSSLASISSSIPEEHSNFDSLKAHASHLFTPFEAQENYQLQGEALIHLDSSSGQYQIHFSSNFKLTPGPDLFIYLTSEVYDSPGNGLPEGIIWESTEQIGVSGQSEEGPLVYTIQDLNSEQLETLNQVKSIRIYCKQFGYILWGGANLQ